MTTQAKQKPKNTPEDEEWLARAIVKYSKLAAKARAAGETERADYFEAYVVHLEEQL
jgi:hypothetical protein